MTAALPMTDREMVATAHVPLDRLYVRAEQPLTVTDAFSELAPLTRPEPAARVRGRVTTSSGRSTPLWHPRAASRCSSDELHELSVVGHDVVLHGVVISRADGFEELAGALDLGVLDSLELQRCGLDRSDAYAAVALNSVAGGIVHVAAMVVAVLLVGRHGVSFGHLPPRAEVLIGLTVVVVVAGVLLWSPLGRRRLIPPLRQGAAAVVTVLRQPVKAAQLFGGSAAITAFYVLALYTSLEAFHCPLPVVDVAAVYLGGAAIAAAAPTPGGLGAMEAALVVGLTGLGAPSGPAIVGVLAFRLVTYWAPILPGWLVFRRLLRERLL